MFAQRHAAWNNMRFPEDVSRFHNPPPTSGALPRMRPRTEHERALANASYLAATRTDMLQDTVEQTKAMESRMHHTQEEIDSHPRETELRAARYNLLGAEPPKDSEAQQEKNIGQDQSNQNVRAEEALHRLNTLRQYLRSRREFADFSERSSGPKLSQLGNAGSQSSSH